MSHPTPVKKNGSVLEVCRKRGGSVQEECGKRAVSRTSYSGLCTLHTTSRLQVAVHGGRVCLARVVARLSACDVAPAASVPSLGESGWRGHV
jgi:hypothetical protein